MTENIVLLANTIIVLVIPFFGVHYVMWKIFGWKMRYLALFAIGFIVYVSVAHFIVSLHWEWTTSTTNLFRLIIVWPRMIFSLWLFRKRFWQALFLHMTNYPYGSISGGMGIYASLTWFAQSEYPLLGASAVTIVISILTLPPFMYLLFLLCNSPGMKNANIWKVIWLLPVLFFGMILLSGRSFVFADFELDGFILSRVITFLFMLLTFYILYYTSRQSVELARLNGNIRHAETVLDMQRGQYERLLQDAETIKKMRHDMKHHLTVLQSYNDTGDTARHRAYVDEISSHIPGNLDEKIYCENFAVNAIASYYLGTAQREGVRVHAQFAMPEVPGSVCAIDLCVIMGNLLENAVNACRRMENSAGTQKFINAASRIEGGSLYIVIENSFDGHWREKNGVYYSMGEGNESREGVGISSVKTVCEKHSGSVRVEIVGEVWRVSVVVGSY